MPTALPTQIQAIVFDGVRPAYKDLRTPHAAVFPWLISFTTVAGDPVDMSGTASATTGWTASWVVSSATGTVLTVPGNAVSGTATVGGSSITWPIALDGQVQVLASVADLTNLSGFLEHTLYLVDQFGNKYKAVYGMLYPSSDTG